MGRLNNDEQFKFLISCIRWSNNGKVDFAEVARECGIVSKGAAAKRYERMMKAHGIHQPTSTARDTAVPPMRRKDNDAGSEALSKKRKIDEFDKANVGTPSSNDASQRIKEEYADPVQAPRSPSIKNEATSEQEYPWLPFRNDASQGTLEEEQQFSDFIAGSFTPINADDGHFEAQHTGHMFSQDEETADKGVGGGRIVIN